MSQFENTPDRRDFWTFKWQKYAGQDVLPCWVADTEFRCAEPILHAMQKQTEYGNFGYSLPAQHKPANDAVVRWLKDKHDWAIEADWIVWTPGVVPAFNVAIKAYCEAGDKVLIQTPNYPPLLAAPGLNGTERVPIPTKLEADRWTIDLEELEKQAADPKCKLMILCNPMNPVGSVMTESEISRIAQICERNDVLLCSDEIHCDLILEEGVSHIPAGRVNALTERSITLMAASKTFNIAGLGTSFAIIPNATLRRQFTQGAAGIVPWANVMGLVATAAAFTECDDWLTEQIAYLRGNRDYLVERINAIDGLKVVSADATFLAWIDASGLGVEDVLKWCESKGVGPSPGRDFGEPDYFRINFGCSRAMLTEILDRLSA
ncbi:MalY/PatB family protein [Alteromonas lipolytica]|uniref:cysteine-S-conjugate beta-lyase n=1 Tax=Alteromonas lipolytica TaxID=1856405 RepID=A0A1E8FA12_9ALTE|nr:PatB family C-S lyase [Alteromonas lipolytica]OFI32751.1 aminotransferase class I/II [Alteromonas lipolytica]GGF73393.1 aspartate aminotransferase [Alteromonas lipolytica]